MHFADYEYTTLESAFYLAFHRVGWGLGLAWIVFACVHGYGGPVNTFLCWSVFQPLGKLTYCTFLVHLAIQFYRIGIMRSNIFGSDYEQVSLSSETPLLLCLNSIFFFRCITLWEM